MSGPVLALGNSSLVNSNHCEWGINFEIHINELKYVCGFLSIQNIYLVEKWENRWEAYVIMSYFHSLIHIIPKGEVGALKPVKPVKLFYWPFQGGASFVARFC